eukprot:2636-Heterococcus_DN1.PRE.2
MSSTAAAQQQSAGFAPASGSAMPQSEADEEDVALCAEEAAEWSKIQQAAQQEQQGATAQPAMIDKFRGQNHINKLKSLLDHAGAYSKFLMDSTQLPPPEEEGMHTPNICSSCTVAVAAAAY